MNLYLDSSAGVKLYVAEPDRPPFIQAVSGADRLIAHFITYAEVHATFEQSGEPLTLACFDKRLNAAARSSGLKLLVH